ncbi:phage portal protein [Microbacterium allomyrinae]|uniref:Phage portal protein n=1 Tax=Microbacterium allomyrinae TaxID=2830666 RepID=A0A9X1LTB7_9MICO|nr:phage portal protein [Microbacterium allomyrinae]MCC2031822.1 phage portal protein [Microbacterium allomyrinae]
MATTPEQWLPILAKRLDARMPAIVRLRKYSTDGDAPMPEMGKNTKKSWEAFQKKARTNYGGLGCQSLAGRIVPNAVRVGTARTSPAIDALRIVWRDNRLDVVFADAIMNMLSVRVGYLVVGTRDGKPIITSETPEKVITAADPAQPWRSRAALRAWRDQDLERDFAQVWVPGVRQRFSRPVKTVSGTIRGTVAGDWEPDGDPEVFDGPVPVYALENENGMAEFEPHIDVIDRINLGKLQRLVVTAYQAFKARALKNLPEQDDNGNDIDWSKRLDFAPGALIDLPEGIDVWESGAVDITPLLSGEKQDARDFAAVMRTPIDVFLPEGQNQSAAGANNAHKGEIQKAKNRIQRARGPMEGSLLDALRILGLDEGETIQVLFESPEHVSLTEKAAAAAQAKAAGKSSRWIAKNIWGMSPDEIDEEEADLAAEQLQTLALTGVPGGGTEF